MPIAAINVPPHPGAEPGQQATVDHWNRYLALLGLHQAALIANQNAAVANQNEAISAQGRVLTEQRTAVIAAQTEAMLAQTQAFTLFPEAISPTVESLVAAWTAHDAALDRLAAALGTLPAIGGGGGAGAGTGSGEGLTAGDVQIVAGLAAAIKQTP